MAKANGKRNNGRIYKKANGSTNGPDFSLAYIPPENIVNLKAIVKEKEMVQPKRRLFFFSLPAQKARQTQNIPNPVYKPKPTIGLVDQDISQTSPYHPIFASWHWDWILGKKLINFVLVCVLLVAPIYILFFFGQVDDVKGKVLGVSFTAYDYLQLAQEDALNMNIDQAESNFQKASDSFQAAQHELSGINSLLLNIGQLVPFQGKKVKSGQALLSAGHTLSEAGSDITAALSPLLQKDLTVFLDNKTKESNLVETLIKSFDYLQPAQLKLQLASRYLEEVDITAIPAEYQKQISLVKEFLPKLAKDFDQTMLVLDVLLEMLGRDRPMRYLMVFQNNHEMRPTGGFIGSFALVDIDLGKIQSVTVPYGGPYEINTYLKEKVISPEPLHLVNPHWYLQDSNWFPDWPIAAKKIIWFYENSGGPSVDGVLTFTPKVIEDLLKVTGPINMPEYNVTVDTENFVPITQNLVEVEYDKETNTPKKFISDLLPVVLAKVFSGQSLSENALEILNVFYQALNEKFILLYSQNDSMQNKIKDLGWAGEIKNNYLDYLMVVNTNIAGGKTDGAIDEIIEHHASIESDGSVINTVTAKRIHRGKVGDPMTGIRNVDYIRFYVPMGSELLDITGYEKIDPWRFQMPEASYQPDSDLLRIEQNSYIDDLTKTRISQEFGKTVFGNWVAVSPGESAKITVRYKLPFKINQATDRYSLYLQKQAGSFGSFALSTVSFPAAYQAIWSYPDNTLEITKNQAKFEHELALDQFYGIVLKK